jgi:tRNA nucleotidyltransferase (CCA-adding enzyme)
VADLAERIRAVPGIDRLLTALDGLAPIWLVGGAVRDLLLGAETVDLDVTVEGDAPAVARELAARLDGDVRVHDRFKTATVRAGDLVVDLATARRESYAHPGALPMVEPGTLQEDLARRDFTINSIAAALEPARLGAVKDPHGGRQDLEDHVVRVLHPRSFLDDPTRLLRAVRYESRLGFRMEPETAGLAREAIDAGALATVSGARVRDELLDLLRESPASGIERMAALGLDRALSPALVRVDPHIVATAAEAAPEVGAGRQYAALAALISGNPDGLTDWLDDLQLRAEDRDAVSHAARKAPQLVRALEAPLPDAALHALLHCELPEVFALAIALGAPREPILRYVNSLATVRLEITGDDLRAAGIPESPAIGQALERTLQRKLDGEVHGKAAELACALEIARELPG